MEFEKIIINKNIIDYLNLIVSKSSKYSLSKDKKTIMYNFKNNKATPSEEHALIKKLNKECKKCKLYIICENTLAFTPRKILQTHECEIKIKLNTDKPFWAEFIKKQNEGFEMRDIIY